MAYGGTGYRNGGAGTIFLKSTTQTYGDLIIDNGGNGASVDSTPLRAIAVGTSTDLASNVLTDTNANFPVPNPATRALGLIGLKLNPNINQSKTFTVIDNTATTIITDPADGDMTAVAGTGDRYIGVYIFDSFSIKDSAKVITYNAITSNELTIDGSTLSGNQKIQAVSIAITNTGVLTHCSTTTTKECRLEVVVDTLTIDTTSKIDVSGRGYLGGWQGDNSNDTGRTLGNTTTGGSGYQTGGSYGGLGGIGSNNSATNAVYGEITNPNELGSGGGGRSDSPAGNGGGLIRITAQSIQLDGSIIADGGSGSAYSGGGSGGGIHIDANSLSGAGKITANGGNGNSGWYAAGGGGGRIAVYYSDISGFNESNIQAYGGTGYRNGTDGTVYLGATAPLDTIIVSGPAEGSTIPLSSVTFTWSGIGEGSLTFATKIDNNAWSAFAPITSFTLINLSDGIHTFSVKAMDSYGREDPTPAVQTFIVDITPPVISGVSTTDITVNGATVCWQTNELATSQIEYGLTPSYGKLSQLDTTLTTNHCVTLSSLVDNTIYHFRVRSRDIAGNEAMSGDYTFTTPPAQIINPSFEQGPNPGTLINLSVGSTDITGWTVGSGNIDYIGSYWNAADGARSLDLNGLISGSIYQDLITIPGQTYEVVFYMAGNPAGGPTIKHLRVFAGSQPFDFTFDISGHSFSNMGWEPRSFTFIATDSTTRLTFQSLDTGFYGPALDNVQVTPIVDITPPVISGVSTTNITVNGATVCWQTDELATSQVEYGITSSYGKLSQLDTTLTTNHCVTLSSLVDNTVYHFRVRSRDIAGNEGMSGDYTFTTSLDTTAPETNITKGPSNGGTACLSTIEICWTGSDNITPTNQLSYSYRSDSGNWSAWDTSTCYTFTLTEGQHTVEVKAKDLSGNEDTTPALLTFKVDMTAPFISSVQADPKAGSAIITWTTNEPGTSQVEYGLSTDYGFQTPLQPSLITGHNVTVTGLNPITGYHYRVKSKDVCGNEAVSSDYTLSTGEDVTPPDTFLTSGPPDNGKACDTTVDICWTGSDDATPSSELQYSYNIDNGNWSSWITETCHTFGGLTEGLHTVLVKAKDNKGNVDSTPAVKYFYVDTTMPSLSNISVDPRDYTAKITWNTSEPATSQVEYGTTSSYGMSSPLNPTMTGAHTVTIDGLKPLTAYHFRVKSNDGCHDVVSNDATFTTTDILYPNLRVTQIDMRGTCRSLERIDFKWLERNDGPGSAVGNWVDKIFLSTDQVLDSQDILLGEFNFSDGLDWETERWRVVTLDMPMMAPGTYYIIVKTDANNAINETNESDNLFVKQIDYLMVKQLTAAPDQIPINLNPGETANGEIDLINLGDTSLTGITNTVEGNASNITVNAVPPSNLNGLTVQKVSYTVSASDESVMQNSPVLRFTSSEGKDTTVTFNVTVNPRYPNLVANPGYLDTTMVRGSQTFVEFEVTNTGTVSANDLKVLIPVADWLSLVTPDNIGMLGLGEKIKVGLSLKPSETLPLGPYTGSIVLSASNASASVNFRFTAISDKTGGLKIIAQDEFTYFADDHPPVANAAVKIKNPYDGSLVAEGTTDTNGQFIKDNLLEGYYNVEVGADKHGTYNGTVQVTAGQTKEIKVFLPRQLVSYTWKVEPVQTEDKYIVTLEAVFETHVPAPVITVEPTILDLSKLQYDADGKATVNYTITNNGLIDANGTTIRFGTHPDYQMAPLNENIGVVPAMSSMIVPVTVQKLTPGTLALLSKAEGSTALGATSSSPSDCGLTGDVGYFYVCFSNQWRRVDVYAITGDCPPIETPNIRRPFEPGKPSEPGKPIISEPPSIQEPIPCEVHCPPPPKVTDMLPVCAKWDLDPQTGGAYYDYGAYFKSLF